MGKKHWSWWPTQAALLRSSQHQPQWKVNSWAISCCSTHVHWQAWPNGLLVSSRVLGSSWLKEMCGSGNRGWLWLPDLWWRKLIPSLILKSLSWRNRGSQKLGELWDSSLWVRWPYYWDSHLSVVGTWVNEVSPLTRFSPIHRFLLNGLSSMARGKVYTGQHVSVGKFPCKQILFSLYHIFLFCEIMPYFEGWSNYFLDINMRAFCFLRKKV